ncbi:ribbon-helix-helix domain-containing protein [Rhizobium sp. RAF56]|jgi:antitoxin ParD1/3/4|uniref:ribbon-helix-helix domain-containing protein n=1 Tax=Rhizobium sp. RAF56 TaxID=3233062 RepID=UPI003F9B5BA6
MTVKTTITLSARHMEFAEKMVKSGGYPSISNVIEAGIEQMMHDERLTTDALSGMEDEIRERMKLPRDQWVSMDEDNVFERVRSRIQARSQK